MKPSPSASASCGYLTLIDADIAHLQAVLSRWLAEPRGHDILTTDYWRRRLHAMINASHLTRAQLAAVDALLLRIDAAERPASKPRVAEDDLAPELARK
jgi:hypothetical protein